MPKKSNKKKILHFFFILFCVKFAQIQSKIKKLNEINIHLI